SDLAMRGERLHEIGRKPGIDHLQGQFVLALELLLYRQLHEGDEQHRAERGSQQQGGQQRAPVAEIVAGFLEEHRPCRCHHSSSTARTKISSRSCSAKRARNSSGEPDAVTRPLLMMTM